MRIPKRDPQQFKVYRWEKDLFDWAGERATDAELHTVMGRCCRAYRVPVPDIALVTKNKRDGVKLDSYYMPDSHSITIRPRHRDKCTAIHEAAHAIADHIFGTENGEWHGPIWFGIYINLLERHRILPRTVLLDHARSFDLKWGPLSLLQPATIRRHARRKK